MQLTIAFYASIYIVANSVKTKIKHVSPVAKYNAVKLNLLKTPNTF
jgi:hypothetical protein